MSNPTTKRMREVLSALAKAEAENRSAKSPSTKYPDDRPDATVDALAQAVRECIAVGREITHE